MGEMGGSVIKASITTLLGMTAMAFASSGSYRTFYFVMLGSVGIGVLHATVLFPVLLSIMEMTDKCFLASKVQVYNSVAAASSRVVPSIPATVRPAPIGRVGGRCGSQVMLNAGFQRMLDTLHFNLVNGKEDKEDKSWTPGGSKQIETQSPSHS